MPFKKHHPKDWWKKPSDDFFTPELHLERYRLLDFHRRLQRRVNAKSTVYLAKISTARKDQITAYNYSSSYHLTQQLLRDSSFEVKDKKILVKPNNTGFVGLFLKDEQLIRIFERKGMTKDADHQPIATQPAVLAGIADALIDEDVKEIHVGENMLWEGGTRRAFWETGYTRLFSQERYEGKVFFVDFYESDREELIELQIDELQGHDIGNYKKFYPPKALFEEHYDLIYLASISKTHNCAHYSLAIKSCSISWNPPKGPNSRWRIHGLPIEILTLDYLKKLFGEDFDPKFRYKILKVGNYFPTSEKETTEIVLASEKYATAPIKTYMSQGSLVLQVDPNHWQGSNLITQTLGSGYLITRYLGMHSSFQRAMAENGSQIACLCSGVVGQQEDGPLLYGSLKYGGFAAASFDLCALEAVCLEIMMATDEKGYAGLLEETARSYQRKYGFHSEEFLNDNREPWTLKLCAQLLKGEWRIDRINLELIDFTGGEKEFSPQRLWDLRAGDPFKPSQGIYCSPKTWLKLAHTEEGIYNNLFEFIQKGVEVPLVPEVVASHLKTSNSWLQKRT